MIESLISRRISLIPLLYVKFTFAFIHIFVEGLRKQDLERHERFKGWQNSLFPSGNKKSFKKTQVKDKHTNGCMEN